MNKKQLKVQSNVGHTERFYLKPKQINLINDLALKRDCSRSKVLRNIIDIYDKLFFVFQKEVNKN